jgi:hypothetical protein
MLFTRYCFQLVLPLLLLAGCEQSVRSRPVQSGEPFNRHACLILTKHARCRMDCRHITLREIREVLERGTINYAKSEPDARPDPKYAIEAYTAEQQHLRIIVAPSGEKLILVTCMELGVEWSCHCN